MTEQIVLQVVRGWDNQTLVQLMRAPNIQDDIGVRPFDCDPNQLPAWTQPGAVQAHGQILFQSLMKSHDRVREALADALKLQAPNSRPIYLHLKALPASEVFCWEALCDAGGNFVALDRRWPIARIAQPLKAVDRTAVAFEPPLKIFAVLSALGRDPQPEWDNVYAAVLAARKAGVPIQLHVGTGDEPLQDHIFGLQDPEVTQFPLQTATDLINEADTVRPHLVHFFCHGSTSLEKPRLQVATLADQQSSSIELVVNDLLSSPGIADSWLTVLNCCEVGGGSQDVHALTHSLVAGGLNATIGMKQTVTEIDAHEFSKRLYPDLLRKLVEQLKALAPGSETTIDWSGTLWAPRKALSDSHKQKPDAREWTVPVLYAQPEHLRIKRAPPPDEKAKAHMNAIEAVLATMTPAQRAAFLAELAAVQAGK